jgi:solute carrier family 35 protein E1
MIVRKGDFRKTLRVVVILLCWWIFSITAGLYNKDYLNLYKLPIYLTLAQSLAGVVCGAIILRLANLLRYPTTAKEIQMLWILTAFHAIGTILTNISTAASAASFMHTIKAAEPLFSAILAVIVLRERLKPLTIMSLFLIVFGIALSCTTEFNFSLGGFLSAMASNVVFASRTIFSKKVINLTIRKNSRRTERQKLTTITNVHFFCSCC